MPWDLAGRFFLAAFTSISYALVPKIKGALVLGGTSSVRTPVVPTVEKK